jgi:fatty acid desaturase
MVSSAPMAGGRAATVEKAWRQRIEAVVPPDELAKLSQRSLVDTIGLLAVLWVEIIVLLAGANLLPRLADAWAVPLGILLVVLIATRINALGVVIHEGSHGFLARSRRLNDRLCNLGAAWWTINSVEEYRSTHRLHHRYLGEERDPDRPSYLVPDRRGALAVLILKDLLGVTAVKRALLLVSRRQDEDGAETEPSAWKQILLGKFALQLVVLGQFVLFQGLWRGIAWYIVFWLVPTLCVYPLILRLKTITEHFDRRFWEDDAPLWVARTSFAGRVQNHLIGARMEYHFEHHVLPNLPFRGLAELHRRLEHTGWVAEHDEVVSGGYTRFLLRLPKPQRDKRTVLANSSEGAAVTASDLDG